MPTPLNPFEANTVLNKLRIKVSALERWQQNSQPQLSALRQVMTRPPGGAAPNINTLLATILSSAGDMLYWDGSVGQALSLGNANEVMTAGASAPQWVSDLREIDSISNGTSPATGNLVDFGDAGVNRGARLGNWWVGNFDIFPGVAHLGYYGLTKGGFYSHAMVVTAAGAVAMNAAAGQMLQLTINGGTALGIGTDVFTGSASLGTFGVPVSLQNGTSINEFSVDGTLSGNSDNAAPTEKAVKTYVDGRRALTIQVVATATATLTEAHRLVKADTSAGAVEITLPEASTVTGEKIVMVRNSAAGGATGTLTVLPTGSEKIQGTLTSITATRAYQTRVYYSDGAGWFYVE